jgi:hypothetical protein
MSNVVYISKSSIERKRGPLRIARLPGEPQAIVYNRIFIEYVQHNFRAGLAGRLSA